MPTKTTMNDLRDHLFETLEGLKDEDKPMDLDRAKAVAEVGKQIIASAKVEVDFMRITGQTGVSRFFPEANKGQLPPPEDKPKAVESPEAARRRKALFPNGELGDQ